MADDLKKNSEELASNMRDALFFSRDFANEAKGISKELFGVSIAASETAKAFKLASTSAQDIAGEVDKVIEGQSTLSSIQKQRASIGKAEVALNREYDQFLLRVIGNEAEIAKIKSGQLDIEDAISRAAAERKTITEEEIGAATDLARLFGEQFTEISNSAGALDEVERRTKNIEKSMGILGGSIGLADVGSALDKGLRKIGAGGIADKLNIKGAVDEAKLYAAELTNGGDAALGLGGRLKVAGKLASGLGKNLMAALGPIGLITAAINAIIKLFKFFFNQVMEIDKEIGETADNLGISYAASQKITAEAEKQKEKFGSQLLTRQNIVKAQNDLNKSMGTTMIFSKEISNDFAKTTKFLNLSEEAAVGFANASLQTGQSISALQANVIGVTQELNFQNNLAMSQKEILEGVAKASDAQFLTAGGSAKALAKQVFEAKKLGMEMSDLEKIGGNLLDFESSINAEMEAELLTGKQLNLEKARQAALDGDLETLAQEISKNIGDSADFAAMNVLQQEAVAKAVGMTREELAGSLRSQEQLAAVSEALGGDFKNINEAQAEYNRLAKAGELTEAQKQKLAEVGLAQQMESASIEEIRKDTQQLLMEEIQSKLIPSMTTMREVAVQISGKFMEIMNTVMEIVAQITEFFKPIIESVKETFFEIGEKANEIFGDVGGISGVFEFIGGVLTDIIDGSLSLFQIAVENIMQLVKGISEVFTGISMVLSGDVMAGLEMIGKGIARFFLSPIQSFINALIEGLNFIIKQINKIPAIEIPTIGQVNLLGAVGLAEGGVVMPRPGGTSAIIGEGGEPEMVLPLSKANTMGFGGGGNQNNTQLQNEMQQVNKNLQMLISAVEQGGDVFIDGAKVGKSLVLATSNLGT